MPQKIRNGVDSMKSPVVYEDSSGIKASIKIGKYTVPNNKIKTKKGK